MSAYSYSSREDLDEYTVKIMEIIETVLIAMASSLDVEPNSFTDQVGKRPTLLTRFNFYPPCSTPHLVLGLKEHSDGSAITILLLDKQVEGLQLRKDDQWYRVPVPAIADSLLIIIGEQAEVTILNTYFCCYYYFYVTYWVFKGLLM